MSLIGPDNAIGWAQVQFKGGTTGILSSTASWGGLMAVGVFAWAWLAGPGMPGTLFSITMTLLGWQAALLVLFGSMRVVTAIRRDLDGGMIESHRLMPTSPAEAVTGYILGSTVPTLALAAVGFVIGMVTASFAGVTPHRWIVPNLLLLETAAFLWVLAGAGAFVSKGAGAMVWFLAIPLFNAGLAGLVPGLSALFNPLVGGAVFDMRTRGAEIGWAQGAAVIAHVAIGAHFFAAACRKYRRPDALAMGPGLTLSLLATWVAVSALAMAAWDEFRPTLVRANDVADATRFVAALVGSLALSVATVWTAAVADAAWRRRRRADDPALGRRPPAVALVAAAATLVLLALAAVAPPPEIGMTSALARSGVAIFAALLGLGYLHRIVQRGGGRSKVVPGIWFTLVWLVPIAADLVLLMLDMRGGLRVAGRETGTDSAFDFASTFSPIGTLGVVWTGVDVSITIGLVAQTVAGLVPVALYHLTDVPTRRKEVNDAAQPGQRPDAGAPSTNVPR